MNEIIAQIMSDDSITDKVTAIAQAAMKEKQSEADKVRSKYSQENKALQEQLKAKELESMTELEKREALFKQQQQEFESQRNEWKKDRIVKEKTDFFKEKGLSLDMFDLVNGGNVEEWEASHSNIAKIIDSQVESRIGSSAGRENIGGNKTPKPIDKFDEIWDKV